MKKKNLVYFTLPEVTMAIAILGIGLISILGVFPVAIKSGLQAVKMSEAIHKARSIANLMQTFAEPADNKLPVDEPLPYAVKIKNDVNTFAFMSSDKMTSTTQFSIPEFQKNRLGTALVVVNDKGTVTQVDDTVELVPGFKNISTFLGGKFRLDRVFVQVDKEFDTYFYVIRECKQ